MVTPNTFWPKKADIINDNVVNERLSTTIDGRRAVTEHFLNRIKDNNILGVGLNTSGIYADKDTDLSYLENIRFGVLDIVIDPKNPPKLHMKDLRDVNVCIKCLTEDNNIISLDDYIKDLHNNEATKNEAINLLLDLFGGKIINFASPLFRNNNPYIAKILINHAKKTNQEREVALSSVEQFVRELRKDDKINRALVVFLKEDNDIASAKLCNSSTGYYATIKIGNETGYELELNKKIIGDTKAETSEDGNHIAESSDPKASPMISNFYDSIKVPVNDFDLAYAIFIKAFQNTEIVEDEKIYLNKSCFESLNYEAKASKTQIPKDIFVYDEDMAINYSLITEEIIESDEAREFLEAVNCDYKAQLEKLTPNIPQSNDRLFITYRSPTDSYCVSDHWARLNMLMAHSKDNGFLIFIANGDYACQYESDVKYILDSLCVNYLNRVSKYNELHLVDNRTYIFDSEVSEAYLKQLYKDYLNRLAKNDTAKTVNFDEARKQYLECHCLTKDIPYYVHSEDTLKQCYDSLKAFHIIPKIKDNLICSSAITENRNAAAIVYASISKGPEDVNHELDGEDSDTPEFLLRNSFHGLILDIIAKHILIHAPQYVSKKDIPEEVIAAQKDLILAGHNEHNSSASNEDIANGLQLFYTKNCLLKQILLNSEGKPAITDEEGRPMSIGTICARLQLKIAHFTRIESQGNSAIKVHSTKHA